MPRKLLKRRNYSRKYGKWKMMDYLIVLLPIYHFRKDELKNQEKWLDNEEVSCFLSYRIRMVWFSWPLEMSKTCLWNFLLNLPTKSKWVSLCNISGHHVNLNSSLNFLTWVGYVIGSFNHFKGPTLKNIDRSNESKAFLMQFICITVAGQMKLKMLICKN